MTAMVLRAPGLKWYKRADGSRIASWVADEKAVKLGYPVKTQRMWSGHGDPPEKEWEQIVYHCHRLRAEQRDYMRKGASWRRNKRHRTPGKVYFVLSGGLMKIGFATNLAKRIQSLQTGSAEPLTTLGSVSGSREIEEFLHWQFRKLREKGEWFRYEGPLKEFVEQSVIERAAAAA